MAAPQLRLTTADNVEAMGMRMLRIARTWPVGRATTGEVSDLSLRRNKLQSI